MQVRTRAKNSLQALAFSAGSAGRSKLLSRQGRQQFLRLPVSEAMGRRRDGWLSLVDELNARIKGLDAWLEQQAKRDERVLRLQTHPGIGLLASLALVHGLEPVARFAGGRDVAAYVGLDPMEYSSGDKQRFGSISQGGSRRLSGFSCPTELCRENPGGVQVVPAGPRRSCWRYLQSGDARVLL